MDTSAKISAIFVELDALFDTRLPIFYSFGEEATQRILDSGYYRRVSDIYPWIDYEEFCQRYQHRDKKVLGDAMVTPILTLIQEFVVETLMNIPTSPFHLYPRVILNMYPYQLTDEEQFIIQEVVHQAINRRCDVDMVSMSYEDITPWYVNANLSIVVMYEYHRWLEIHSQSEAFKKATCPQVALIGPALFFSKPTKETLALCEKIDMSPFQAIEKAFSPLIGVKLMDVEHFSLSLKLTKETTRP